MDTTPEQYYQQAMTLLNIAQATMNEGTEKEAFELLQKSAEQDHIPALLQLAHCYDNGIGTEYDEDEADDCFRKAADLGSEKAACQYAYRMYYNAYDHETAYEYVQKALNGEDSARAHYLLGLIWYHGEGTDYDIDKSYAAHQQAAALGNTDAMFELYVYHSQGYGCEPDPQAAFEWNQKAADLGHYRACFNMGWFYETGTNVIQDLQKAFDYYKTSSENGNGKATAYVGVMLQRGDVKPAETLDADGNWDTAKAQQLAETYYERSEDQGFYQLEEYLDQLGVER